MYRCDSTPQTQTISSKRHRKRDHLQCLCTFKLATAQITTVSSDSNVSSVRELASQWLRKEFSRAVSLNFSFCSPSITLLALVAHGQQLLLAKHWVEQTVRQHDM